jgi:flagellar hook assembly protein FlgD
VNDENRTVQQQYFYFRIAADGKGNVLVAWVISEESEGEFHPKIDDLSGGLVRVFDNSDRNSVENQVTWDGKAVHDETVPIGVYVCRLESGKTSSAKRMVLLR